MQQCPYDNSSGQTCSSELMIRCHGMEQHAGVSFLLLGIELTNILCPISTDTCRLLSGLKPPSEIQSSVVVVSQLTTLRTMFCDVGA